MIQVYGTYMVKWYKYLVNIVVKWYKYMGIKMVNTIEKDGYTCMYIYIYTYGVWSSFPVWESKTHWLRKSQRKWIDHGRDKLVYSTLVRWPNWWNHQFNKL